MTREDDSPTHTQAEKRLQNLSENELEERLQSLSELEFEQEWSRFCEQVLQIGHLEELLPERSAPEGFAQKVLEAAAYSSNVDATSTIAPASRVECSRSRPVLQLVRPEQDERAAALMQPLDVSSDKKADGGADLGQERTSGSRLTLAKLLHGLLAAAGMVIACGVGCYGMDSRDTRASP